MKIALLGGSFNPPHVGHTFVCCYLLEVLRFDEVWMLPSYRHPFGKELAEFSHRVKMCKIAVKSLGKRVRVKTTEKKIGGRGYTVKLVEYLVKHYPQHSFSLVVGSDILNERNKWKDYDQLEKMVCIVVINRGGYRCISKRGVTIPEVSSNRIRSLLKKRRDISLLVPSGVKRYIERHRLYQR